nr:HAD family hydrolase [Cellulomonas denverensis]
MFDIDDTLVDTRGAFALALAAVSAVWLPGLAPERAGEVLAHWRADVHGRYRQYTRGEVGYDQQRMDRANDLHRDFGGPQLDEQGYAEWNALFERTFSGSWAAHADASVLVDRLLAAGIKVGALSNAGTAYQVRKLTGAGLIDRVPMLVGVDTLGFGKPDPRVFTEACARLGTAPERTAYVGDELDVDARAATAAGLTGIWLDRSGAGSAVHAGRVVTAGESDRVIRSLAELPGLLGLDRPGDRPGPGA